jgi:long-chain acyl-CoA synthetase
MLEHSNKSHIEDGRITITGRIKDIIVTSTGEKIAPADLEMAIIFDPLFEQAMVIGEQRPYLAGLVVLNANEWQREKARLRKRSTGVTSPPTQYESDFLLRRIAEAVKEFRA